MTASGKRLSASSPRFEIDITEEIIAKSCRADSAMCMIAEAVKAARPDVTRVMVDLQTIRFTDPAKGQRYVYFTPRIGQDALIAFDQGDQIEPFKLRLLSAVQVVTATGPKGPARLARRSAGGSTALVKVGGTPPPIAPLAHGEGVAHAERLTRPNIFDRAAKPRRDVEQKPSGKVAQSAQPDIAEPPAGDNKPAADVLAQSAQLDIAEPPADVAQPRTRAATEASANRRLDQKVGRRREFGLRAMKR